MQLHLRPFRVCSSLLTVFALGLPSLSPAQWSDNPNTNNPISTATNNQKSATIAGDGSSGAIVTWQDRRSGTNEDVYVQRIDASGMVQWTSNGVVVSAATDDQVSPAIISDGSGGAIITWQDKRSGTEYDIYAQLIDASGTVQWTADGVVISGATSNQESPTIASDGAGGAIITWHDARGANNDVYAQRIDASGTVQWTADGVAVSTAAEGQWFPQITSDGSGGAVITWIDQRSGSDYDVYAQRIDASGTVQWTADGVLIASAASNTFSSEVVIIGDGAGGAIIAWEDYRSGTYYDIYSQRINASGAVQWTANGVAISTEANHQYLPKVTSDGAGGAIIAWQDQRGTSSDIYAQLISTSGVVQWTADGVALSTGTSGTSPTITSDSAGGAVVAWQDHRNGDADIYAQRIDGSGTVQWTANGVAISTPAASAQEFPVLVTDGTGGAIIAWQDFRSTTDYDIYATRVFDSGSLPVTIGFFTVSVHPNGSAVTLEWTTESETNNYGFEIERRIIGSHDWVTIGFVAGAGTSNSQRAYTYADAHISPGRYAYRIRQIDLSGQFTYTHATEVEIGSPAEFALMQNYPNPFNPNTAIVYQIAVASRVRLVIHDALGREVAVLADADRPAGLHKEFWNAAALASGTYFAHLTVTEGSGAAFVFSKAMMLVK